MPRPIVAGGTGASTAGAAISNLGGMSKAGDTMTGTLIIQPSSGDASIYVDKPNSGTDAFILGRMAGKSRWQIDLGDGVAETGGNAGSNFGVSRFNDAGSVLSTPLQINRATGTVTINNAPGNPAALTINKSASGQTCSLYATNGGTLRWVIDIGGSSTESGSNAGSDFAIGRYSDAGSGLGAAFSIARSTGVVAIPGPLNIGSYPLPALSYAVRVSFQGNGNQYGIGLQPSQDNTAAVDFRNAAGAQVGFINSTSSATAYNTSSDGTLKADLKTFDAGATIDALKVYDFKWKRNGQRSHGVVAQEAIKVFPGAVTHIGDMWGVDYSKFVPLLLQEVKALRARVAQLERK